jgi:hypothetical protein
LDIDVVPPPSPLSPPQLQSSNSFGALPMPVLPSHFDIAMPAAAAAAPATSLPLRSRASSMPDSLRRRSGSSQ